MPLFNINHLNRSLAINDNIVIADEREILIVVVCVPADGKHQLKPRSIILQQLNILAGDKDDLSYHFPLFRLLHSLQSI